MLDRRQADLQELKVPEWCICPTHRNSFRTASCIEPPGPLRLLANGPQRADLLPPDGLAELRELRWVMGDEVVELAGIGYYHAGSRKRGLLG